MRLQLCSGISASLVAAAWLTAAAQSANADYLVRKVIKHVRVVRVTPVSAVAQKELQVAECIQHRFDVGKLGPEEYCLYKDKLSKIDAQRKALFAAQNGLTASDQEILVGKLNTLQDKLNMEVNDQRFISSTPARYWY